MIRIFLAALFLGYLLAPAFAGKDRDHGGKQEERALTKVEDIQDQLKQEDLSADRRDALEGQLDRIVERYGITLPPPPTEEPTVLFKDDFSRDQTEVGNGWAGHDGSIEGQHMRLTGGGDMYTTVPLDGPYKTVTVSFDLIPDLNGSGQAVGQDASMYWSESDPSNSLNRQPGITTELHEFPDHTHYTYTTPEKLDEAGEPEAYTSFAFGFATDSSTAAIDNVTVTGVPMPAAEPFVGY